MVNTRLLIAGILGIFLCFAYAESAAGLNTVNLNAADLIPHAEILFTPQSATFLEGATFEVSIFLDTKGSSINAVELHIGFDADKLSIVKPSGGKSIIGLWVEPPSYDNTRGTAKIIGAIPNGIKSDSGLIATMTFRAKTSGEATVALSNASQVLLNDGIGSPAILDSNRGRYAIVPRPPDGVQVFSETHPFTGRWYNNNSPVLTWNQDSGVTGFSIMLDTKPTTIPDNTLTATDTVASYQNLSDGISFFHIKALRRGVWGNTSHYPIRIDTTPPAEFTPTIDYLSAAAASRFLVSFFTTDALSGVDHYEIGVIDKGTPVTESPVFIQSESPYQLPFDATQSARVIIRAFDKAGNIREESLDARAPFLPLKVITDNAVIILLSLLILIIGFFIVHYLLSHRVVLRIERGFELLKKEEMKEKEMVSSSIQGDQKTP